MVWDNFRSQSEVGMKSCTKTKEEHSVGGDEGEPGAE